MAPAPQRIAVVDFGTNSTRLLVADVDATGRLRELERRTTVTRLGDGIDATGRLADDAVGRVLKALADYRDMIDAVGNVQQRIGVATSAVRDATNGDAFVATVAADFGIDVRTITGDEEARLTFLGATAGTHRTDGEAAPAEPGGEPSTGRSSGDDAGEATARASDEPAVRGAGEATARVSGEPAVREAGEATAHVSGEPAVRGAGERPSVPGAASATEAQDTLVIDIGGGSTEYVVGVPGTPPAFHVSTRMGSVRFTERHLHHDPPPPAELTELDKAADEVIAAAVPRTLRPKRAIAVAGTPTSLAAIDQQLDPYDPVKVHGYILARTTVERIAAQLARTPLAERRAIAGLHPDRAPTIVAGAQILVRSLNAFDLDELEVSEADILQGAALTAAVP